MEGGQPNLRLFNQLYWMILCSFLLVLHTIFPLPHLIRLVSPLFFCSPKTSNPWPKFKDFWTLRTATLTTATQPYTNNWLGIASTILAICYCQGQGLNVQLFRGTFPADSKRGRICLLHDMRGDSEFEVNWTISMINNFDFKVHLNISFHDKQFWLQGTFEYFFSWWLQGTFRYFFSW